MKLWKKRAAALLWAFCICVLFPGVVHAEDGGEMIARVRKGVVQIAAVLDKDEGTIKYATGTGFGIGKAGEDTNVFATNWHVVTDEDGNICDEIYIMLDNADLWDENTLVRCEVLYTTTGYPDFAIIRATEEVKGLKALPLLQSETALVGSTVYALGYPAATEYGTSHSTIDDITVTSGIISKFMEVQDIGTKCIVHHAHINHGNSGGPLVTAAGAVIGLNTYTIGEDETYSYAVYVDYVIEALDELELVYEIYEEGQGAEALPTAVPEQTTEPIAVQNPELVPIRNPEPARNQDTEPTQNPAWEQKADMIFLAAVIFLAVIVLAACIVVWGVKKSHRADRRSDPSIEPGSLSTGYLVLSTDGRRISISEGSLIIGRDTSCGIRLPTNTRGVSRQHCRLTLENGVVSLTDIGSSYGTFVNQQRLKANSPVTLHRGTSFYLGEPANTFTIL